RDDHVRGEPPGSHADAAACDLRRVRPELRRDTGHGGGARGDQRSAPAHAEGGPVVAALSTEFTLPLRTFELELALEVEQTVALVGPSGSGKSSVLRAIAGLVKPAAGRIALGDDVWFDGVKKVFRRPDERSVGLVFQDYALFPHLTVRKNIEYARRHPA